MDPPIFIHAHKAVKGGQVLKTLWEKYPEPRSAIAKGYDIVVLQEDLPETTVANFREFSFKFVEDIKKTGARPILFMAWAYKRVDWISMLQIADEHRTMGNTLRVDVSPVGLAWERIALLRPDINLFMEDQEHPSIHGTYLATAVIFSTIFNINPTHLAYLPNGVSAETGTFIRRTAWETSLEFQQDIK